MTKKRLRQRAGDAVGGHLKFLHRFEQRTLGLGRGPVDLVDEDHRSENRPRMKHETAMLAVEDGIADDVRRQQVASELNPPELQPERTRQRLG